MSNEIRGSKRVDTSSSHSKTSESSSKDDKAAKRLASKQEDHKTPRSQSSKDHSEVDQHHDTEKKSAALTAGLGWLSPTKEPETKKSNEKTKEETDRRQHGENFDKYFSILGGKDGKVSKEDLNKIADGDFDEKKYREQLEKQGIKGNDVHTALDEIQDLAEYYTDNRKEFRALDGANDDGKHDGIVTRDDVERTLRRDRSKDRRAVKLTDEQALKNLDEHFDVFDNTGKGKNDGKIGNQDLEKVANGTYDRDAARTKLRKQGVPEAEINKKLTELEASADKLLESKQLDDIDSANAKDGKVDGVIRHGDVDQHVLDKRSTEDIQKALQPTEKEIKEAQAAYQNFSDPAKLAAEFKKRPDLAQYNSSELLALSQLAQDDPKVQKQLEGKVQDAVDDAEKLSDLPQGLGFQSLLKPNLDDKQTLDHINKLVHDQLNSDLNGLLKHRSGDSEADLSLERFGAKVEDLALRYPGLTDQLIEQSGSVLQGQGEAITDVRQDDDSLLSKAGHVVTSGLRSGAGFIGDRIKDVGKIAGAVLSAPFKALGEVAEFAAEKGGAALGGALDAVGADGIADEVRGASQQVGNAIDKGTDFVVKQQKNFNDGLFGGAAGAVEGITAAVTDPVGTVKGIGALIKDPSLIIDSYQQIVKEQGFAGLAGNLAFDVLTAVATGGSSGATSITSKLGKVADVVGETSIVARVAAKGVGVVEDISKLTGKIGDLPGTIVTKLSEGGEAAQAVARAIQLPGELKGAALEKLGERATLKAVGESSEALAISKVASKSFEDLKTNLGKLKQDGLSGDALKAAEHAEINKVLEGQLENARSLDKLNVGKEFDAPGEVLATGREEILQRLINDVDLDAQTKRTIGRGALADADPNSPLALVNLPAGSEVGRVFSSNARVRENLNTARQALEDGGSERLPKKLGTAGPEGSYFGPAEDIGQLSPRLQRRLNSLPNFNKADRGLLVRLERDELALVSKVGPKLDEFGAHATGGGRQIQFFDKAKIAESIKNHLREGAADGVIELMIAGKTYAIPAILLGIEPALEDLRE
jgi:hypothetical protein